LRQRAGEHGKVLGENERLAAVDCAPPRNDAVARYLGLVHPEFGGAVFDEHVELLEGALVEQKLDALARGQFAAGVLRLDALLAATQPCPGATFFKGVQNVLHWPPPAPDKTVSGGSNTETERRNPAPETPELAVQGGFGSPVRGSEGNERTACP